jgi:exosortase/archaeosortase family protein
LLISFLPGLRGGYPLESRLQVILIGVLGTVIVNLVRMSGVALLLVWWGYEPAILFHDYGGTLMIAGWLFAFWAFIHRWILPEPVDQHALVSGS